MPLLDHARLPVRAGSHKPSWRLMIDGRDYSSRVVFATPQYGKDGQSMMPIGIGDYLSGREGADVELHVGYGQEMRPFFKGILEEAQDSPRMLYSQASVYGIGKLLAEAKFGSARTFTGTTLQFFYNDMMRQASIPQGSAEIRGPSPPTLTDLNFVFGTTCLEAENEVLTGINYVSYDNPVGRRIAMPKPLPGSGNAIRATYTESMYTKDALQITQAKRNFYSRVVVFRQATGGSGGASTTYDVWAEKDVNTRGIHTPPSSRIYTISDYKGSQADAEKEAAYLARALEYGAVTFTLSGSPVDFSLYDGILIQRTELMTKDKLAMLSRSASKSPVGLLPKKPGLVRATYQCVLDENISIDIRKGTFKMQMSGTGLKISEQSLPSRVSHLDFALSPATVPDPAEPKDQRWTRWGQDDFTFAEIWDVPLSEFS